MLDKKQIIILLVLLAVLAGAVFFYHQTYSHWPWQKSAQVAAPTASVTATPEISSQSTPYVKTERDIIMEDVAQTIAEISPVEPVLGGHWFVDRFWFVSGTDSDFYVEYEDGHILRRVLLQAQEKETGLSYKVVAYFEPGESQWTLKSGQDTQFSKNLDLYEFDDTLGRWTRRN
jgi:hypothetical protein